ncbi:MAG: 2-oxoacid:ferredoxin oxidoreductase subunit beta [Candidatus Dormibacteria bacterium]
MSAVVNENRLGLTRDQYKGAATTLCAGCGHNSITNHIIKALYEFGIEPYRLAKMSGIGCSSKATAYFVDAAHGFNGTHGRMPSLATGAKLANRELTMIGISGDGDTASIGLGQFCHMIRRNLDITYVVENNGCYGLTKGQFSATADRGSVQKRGQVNEFETIDVCGVAIELGASFVARSFSGDGKQLVPLVQAALAHGGTAVLDVISPCVTFNDHEGSTKSYKYVKEHDLVLQDLDFIPFFEEIQADYPEGSAVEVDFHDGSKVMLRKLGEEEHDPRDRIAAMRVVHEARERGELVTGLLYVNTEMRDLVARESLPARPLRDLGEDDLRPSRDEFAGLMKEFA